MNREIAMTVRIALRYLTACAALALTWSFDLSAAESGGGAKMAGGTETVGNLIQNGCFEANDLRGWTLGNNLGETGVVLDRATVHAGLCALKAVPDAASETSLMTDKIAVDIDTTYTLSLWIKTQNISKPDGVSVRIIQKNDNTGWNSWYPTGSALFSPDVKVIKTGRTHEWTRFSATFVPDGAGDHIRLCLCLDAEMTGTVWFDDVSLGSVATRIAQRDFTGDWHNVKIWRDQVRWVEKDGASDALDIRLAQGEYSVWLSMLGDNHPDIEVTVDGKMLGTGDGRKPTGWRKFNRVSLSGGVHVFRLTNRDPRGLRTKAAYAGMVIATDPSTPLPNFSAMFNVPLETIPVTLYPPKPSDSNLTMVVCSYLTDVNFAALGAVGFPSEGAARIAAIAHKHQIPVTWLVSNQAALKMKDLLTRWHNEYGDDVASFDWEDWGPLKAALPWASTNVAVVSAGLTRPVARLEKAGMQAAWGWCWEQSAVDNTCDRGCPWAPFYASHNSNDLCYKIPADYPGKVLGVEWTMRDLNKSVSIHSGEACRFSSDPDEPRRGHFLYGRAIEYWKQLLDEYLRNTEWNEFIPFIFQQESHEMEWSFPWRSGNTSVHWPGEPIPQGEHPAASNWRAVNANAQAMDEFFKYAKTKRITFMTLPQMAKSYQKKYPAVTPSHYMLFRDIPTQKPVQYVCPGAPLHPGPYPLTFQFFDAECQLAFEDGVRLPKRVFNYLRQAAASHQGNYPEELNMPTITSFIKKASKGKEIWSITVANPNPYLFPMGITEWGNYSGYAAKPSSAHANLKEVKIIGETLAFVRFNVDPNARSTITVEFSTDDRKGEGRNGTK